MDPIHDLSTFKWTREDWESSRNIWNLYRHYDFTTFYHMYLYDNGIAWFQLRDRREKALLARKRREDMEEREKRLLELKNIK